MFLFLKNRNIKRFLFAFIPLVLLLINISLYCCISNQKSIQIKNKDFNQNLTQQFITDQWFKESHEEQWIDNSEFKTGEDWYPVITGDTTDVGANIANGRANYEIIGESNSFYIEAIPPTSDNWTIVKNREFPILPDLADFDAGCHVSHYWNEDANQSISAHWEKNITMSVDMSDYIITSAEVNAVINATVRGDEGPTDGIGGIEVPGDLTGSGTTHNSTYDYARFYILISDLNKNEVYEIAYYQTLYLGNDSFAWDTLTDTLMIPISEESFKFYLSSVLNYDNHNFTISLGIRIWCEDNWDNDDDNWRDLRIKSFNLTFNYIKKINQFSTISWGYNGDDIDAKGGRVEVTEAKLNFDYIINQLWPVSSPNSEFKIFISDQEHSETVKLKNAEIRLKEVIEDDFDVTDLIPTDDDIDIVIQIVIADEFQLGNIITISIDNVELDISYDIYLPAEQSFLYEILFIIALTVAGILTGYYIYYNKVLKYPKPIRKLRKFRKSLKKAKPPNVEIMNRNIAFDAIYKDRTEKLGVLSKSRIPIDKPLDSKRKVNNLLKAKSSKKRYKKKKTNSKNKGFLIVLLFIFCLTANTILFNFSINPIKADQKEKTLFLGQISEDERWLIQTNTEQWIDNSEFNDDEGWDSKIEGDARDVDAYIKDGDANFEISGDTDTFIVASGTPNSTSSIGWKQVLNPRFPSFPDVTELNSSGCYAAHAWIAEGVGPTEWADQSPSVHWDKNVTVPVDMSDYLITSASISAVVNATALTDSANGYGSFGVEAGNDNPPQKATLDYVRFYVLISDLEKSKNYELAHYQTTDLGQNTPEVIDQLNDTYMITVSENYLKFFLTSVLNTDYRHFTVTLGILIWCEDNYPQDQDTWTSLIINEFNLNFEYIKKIDQTTSVSWEYEGEEIKGEEIEVTDGKLYFDYIINKKWTSLSPNSELRIFINDEMHSETFKLREFEDKFQEADDEGIDVTNLIPDDEEIVVKIQLFIADEFGSSEIYVISIDNVVLDITYNELLPVEQTFLFLVLFIIALVGSICLTIYIIYYQRVLKYPKPVRKVRKYRRSLKKNKPPDVSIIGRNIAYKAKYKGKLESISSGLKRKPSKKAAIEYKSVEKIPKKI